MGKATPEGMVESAKFHVQILEELGFEDIIISLKASDTDLAIKAYELAAQTFLLSTTLRNYRSGNSFLWDD